MVESSLKYSLVLKASRSIRDKNKFITHLPRILRLQFASPKPASPAISWQEHRNRRLLWVSSGNLRQAGRPRPRKRWQRETQEWFRMRTILNSYSPATPWNGYRGKRCWQSKTVEMAQGDAVYREAPEYLAAQLTGLPIPVDALSWWVRGLASPTPTFSHRTGNRCRRACQWI